MLYWALVFFAVSIVAGMLGMWGVAGMTMGVAKILVGLFLIATVVFLIIGVVGANKTKDALK